VPRRADRCADLVRQAVIFTSDPGDLARIVAALNASLRLHPA